MIYRKIDNLQDLYRSPLYNAVKHLYAINKLPCTFGHNTIQKPSGYFLCAFKGDVLVGVAVVESFKGVETLRHVLLDTNVPKKERRAIGKVLFEKINKK